MLNTATGRLRWANGALVGPGKDFSKFYSKFACARSVRKLPRNLPMCAAQHAENPSWVQGGSPAGSEGSGIGEDHFKPFLIIVTEPNRTALFWSMMLNSIY